MINFKNRDEAIPSALILLSLLILAASLVFLLLPKPSVAGLVKSRERNLHVLQNDIDNAKKRTEEADAAALPRLWQGDPQAIMARVLAQVSDGAAKAHVQMSSFRPQKQQSLGNVAELPFTAQISGPYPAVRAMLAGLDAPTSKIVLRSVQMASANGSTDAVTASIGISVYCEDNTPVPAPAVRPAARPATGGAAGG